MSRPLRIEYENAFYHVMNRGRGRENTFLSDDDFKYFLHCIEQASFRFNIEVHSYCLFNSGNKDFSRFKSFNSRSNWRCCVLNSLRCVWVVLLLFNCHKAHLN